MPAGPRIITGNRKQTTMRLRHLMKQRKRKALVLDRRVMAPVHQRQEEHQALLKEMQDVLQGRKAGARAWNKQLAGCNELLLASRASATFAQVHTAVKRLDEKVRKVATTLNGMLAHIARQDAGAKLRSDEIADMRESLEEFVSDTLEEVNRMTAEVRQTRNEAAALASATGIKLDTFASAAPSKAPKVLIATMFRLYENGSGTSVQELFKNRRRHK